MRSSFLSTMPHGATPTATTLFLALAILSEMASPTCFVTPETQNCYLIHQQHAKTYNISTHLSSTNTWLHTMLTCIEGSMHTDCGVGGIGPCELTPKQQGVALFTQRNVLFRRKGSVLVSHSFQLRCCETDLSQGRQIVFLTMSSKINTSRWAWTQGSICRAQKCFTVVLKHIIATHFASDKGGTVCIWALIGSVHLSARRSIAVCKLISTNKTWHSSSC